MGNVMGVLPSTLKSYARCVYFQMYSASTTRKLAEGLLQAGMEFVAPARPERRGVARPNGGHDGVDHRIVAALAGEHQVLVERRLQSAGVGSAHHGVRPLDVVSHAEPRLKLFFLGEAVVEIGAQTQC